VDCPESEFDWGEPTVVGWTVAAGGRGGTERLAFGFFLTSAEALHAMIDFKDARLRFAVGLSLEVQPIFAAEVRNVRTVLALRKLGEGAQCRVNGCAGDPRRDGFNGYCAECADEVYGVQAEVMRIRLRT